MKFNMGKIDRLARLVLAASLGVLVGTGSLSGGAAIAALAVAVVMTATSLVGICPLYLPLGLSTRKKIAKTEPT